MDDVVFCVQTACPSIRFTLWRRHDGALQFAKQHWSDQGGWAAGPASRPYGDELLARHDMVRAAESSEAA